MTEKRFYLLNYKNNPIYDSETGKEYNAQYKKQRQNLCDLLNKLNNAVQTVPIQVSVEISPKYTNGDSAKWYYNTDNNITDGEKEYTIHRKEQVEYLDGTILYGTNDLLDKLNDYEKENEELRKDREYMFICERDTKNDWRELQKENEQLKKRISELELLNDGLNYALKNIKKIDVEIDLGDNND